MEKLIPISTEKRTISEPFECPHCAGHVIFDDSYLEQVSLIITCPYCNSKVYVHDDDIEHEESYE